MDLINKYFPVLDEYGFCALKGVFGTDEDIETAARTSYGKGTRATSDTRNLLRYLLRNSHSSPYEFVQFKFHISCPIFVARQWFRHRMSSFNELSGRYSVLPQCNYFPAQDKMTLQSTNNKQGRSDELMSDGLYEEEIGGIKANTEEGWYIYDCLIKEGVAKEVARSHLPVSTYTEFYWSIDLHNLLHFLKLRCDSHAQWEIRVYANIMAGMVKEYCPLAFDAWYDYRHKASTFTRLDKILLNKTISMLQQIQDEESETIKCVYEIGKSIGMSKREVDEYIAKIKIPDADDFTLNLSEAKTAEHYQKIRQGDMSVTENKVGSNS